MSENNQLKDNRDILDIIKEVIDDEYLVFFKEFNDVLKRYLKFVYKVEESALKNFYVFPIIKNKKEKRQKFLASIWEYGNKGISVKLDEFLERFCDKANDELEFLFGKMIKKLLRNKNKDDEWIERLKEDLKNNELKEALKFLDSEFEDHHGERYLLKEFKGNNEKEIHEILKNEFTYKPVLKNWYFNSIYNTQGVKIFFIDDKFEFMELKTWEKVKKYFSKSKSCELYKIEIKEQDIEKILKEKNIFKAFKIKKLNGNTTNANDLEEELKRNICFFVVDLIYHGKNIGYKLIRKLDIERGKQDLFFEIIVFSRLKDTAEIQRCLNEGATAYVFKDNLLELPAVIAKIAHFAPSVDKIKKRIKIKAKTQNFRKLYRLPWNWRKGLFYEPLLPAIDKNDIKDIIKPEMLGKIQKIFKKEAKKWLDELPKIELHSHFAPTIPLEIIWFNSYKSSEYISKLIKSIYSKILNKGEKYKCFLKKVFEILSHVCLKIRCKNVPSGFDLGLDEKIEEMIKNLSNEEKEIFLYNISLLKIFIINLFVTWAGLKTGIRKNKNNILKDKNNIWKKCLSMEDSKDINLDKDIDCCFNLSLEELFHNPQASSLKDYLLGTKFFGAEQLQFKDTLLLASYSIAYNLAVYEKIRYIELRTAPYGYIKLSNILTKNDKFKKLLKDKDLEEIKKQLFSSEKEILETILYGLYLGSREARDKKGEYILPALILVGKRHKSPKEITLSVDLANVFRNWEAEENKENEFKKLFKGIVEDLKEILGDYFDNKEKKENKRDFQYPTDTYPRVVGFDLAGLEKGFDFREFVNYFMPLFRVYLPITVHAGEEEGVENIWKAIYYLQAQRLGHSLRLTEDMDLLRTVRDRGIHVELCPWSNYYTNKEFQINPEKYPAKIYLKEGIRISVNTDDRALSNTTLSDEFIKLLEFVPNLPKWEILRILRHALVASFMDKEAKSEFFKSFENELYEKIIELEGIERKKYVIN